MIIEIGYSYQLDKNSPVENSWTYFYVKGDDVTKGKTKAKTYWKKFINELGWTKKATVTHIEEIQNGKNYIPAHIVVDSRELAPARKRTSTQPKISSQSRRTSPRRNTNKKSV